MGGYAQKAVNGALWSTLGRFVFQAMSFVVTLVLARLLTPGDYGTIAILGVFLGFAAQLASSGLGVALVQKKDATSLDFNTMFYASLVLAGVFYAILFVAAPFIAKFYGMPELKNILRVMAFSLVLSAMSSVQFAELRRKLKFKEGFWVGCVSSVVAAVAGVVFALLGWGAWALVMQTMLRGVADVVGQWFFIAWRPKREFSFEVLKGLFKFGWQITAVSLVGSVYSSAYALVIGKVYEKEALAFVNKGRTLPTVAMGTISGTVCSVAFPILAQMQDERERLKSAVRRMAMSTAFMVFPLMAGAAVCAGDLVRVLFGEQWMECVPYMRIACFSLALQPFHDINLQTIAALGKGDVFMKLELIKDTAGLAVACAFLWQGVLPFMLAMAFMTAPFALVVNTWHNAKFINYPLKEQLADVAGTAVAAGVMALVVAAAGWVFPRDAAVAVRVGKLAVQTVAGGAVYFALSYVAKAEAMREYALAAEGTFAKRSPKIAGVFGALARRLERGGAR